MVALGVFLAAAFVLPTEAAFSFVFYLALLPMCWRARVDWGLAPALALIGWSALTLLWGEGGAARSWHFLLGAVCTAAFFLGAVRALRRPGAALSLAGLLAALGALNASISLVLGAAALTRGERVLGWGVTRQPVLGGSVMAVCCMSALLLARRGGGGGLLCWLAAAVMAVFILAMDSRGALLGFLCGGAIVLLSWPGGRRVAAGAVLVCIVLAGLPAVRVAAARLLLARGDSQRFQIWRAALAATGERPVFGHGLGANLAISPTGFPHSLYLSLLFYSGAVGLGLFALMVVALGRRWWTAERDAARIWVAALGANALAAGLTDFGQITKGPGPLWVIFWLPVAMTLTLQDARYAEGAARPG